MFWNSSGGKKAPKITYNRLSVRKSLAVAAVDFNSESVARKTLLKANSSSFENELKGVQNSRFNERETEKKIAQLARIYLTTEHLLKIQNNLVLDNEYTSIASKLFEKPLVPFEDLTKFDEFEFAINSRKVCDLVENLAPNAQKVTFFSKTKFQEVKSVFYFNIEQIVPELAKEKEETEEGTFHFLSYSEIRSK